MARSPAAWSPHRPTALGPRARRLHLHAATTSTAATASSWSGSVATCCAHPSPTTPSRRSRTAGSASSSKPPGAAGPPTPTCRPTSSSRACAPSCRGPSQGPARQGLTSTVLSIHGGGVPLRVAEQLKQYRQQRGDGLQRLDEPILAVLRDLPPAETASSERDPDGDGSRRATPARRRPTLPGARGRDGPPRSPASGPPASTARRSQRRRSWSAHRHSSGPISGDEDTPSPRGSPS